MARWLRERLATFAERPFLVTEVGAASPAPYAALVAAMESAHRAILSVGLPSGAVVAIRGDYGVFSVAWLLALAEADTIVVPVARVTAAEWEARVAAAGIQWVVNPTAEALGELERVTPARLIGGSDEAEAIGSHPLLRQLTDRQAAGLVLFSSGSSGPPKAMVHDLDALLDSFQDRRARRLVMMVFLLFDHIGGLNTLFGALAGGLTLVAPTQRDPETVAALIARHQVNILPTSPTFLNLLLLSDAVSRHDLSSLKIITYGTEPMPEALLGRLRHAFPRARLIQTFGTSETGIAQTSSRANDSTFFRLEDPSLEWKIVDGVLWLRSQTQVLGYLNADMAAFHADGWFNTGDLVEEAADGYLRVLGRGSDLINVGGEKVLPAEVESVILQLPTIADCLVRGQPNPITGQTVTAEVVARDPSENPATLRQSIRQHCRAHLSPFKVPTRITVVPELTHSDRFKKIRR